MQGERRYLAMAAALREPEEKSPKKEDESLLQRFHAWASVDAGFYTGLFGRSFIQLMVQRYLDSIVLSPEASVPGQRRLVEQRVTRTILGGTMSLLGPSRLLANSELLRGRWLASDRVIQFIVRLMSGYFVSDMAEIVWSQRRYDSPSQNDLIIHHIVGLGLNRLLENQGHFYFSMALIGEALTFLTGATFFLSALPAATRPSALLSVIGKLRLKFLQYVRMPLFLILMTHVANQYRKAKNGKTSEGMTKPGARAMMLMGGTICCMDLYWIRMLKNSAQVAAEAKNFVV